MIKSELLQIWDVTSGTILPMQNPSEYIKHRMELDGDNVHSLAKKAKMNHSTLHRIIHEESETRRSTLTPLARYYGIEVDEFYREIERNPLEGLPLREVKRWVLNQGYDSGQYKDLADAIFRAALDAVPSDDETTGS